MPLPYRDEAEHENLGRGEAIGPQVGTRIALNPIASPDFGLKSPEYSLQGQPCNDLKIRLPRPLRVAGGQGPVAWQRGRGKAIEQMG